MNPKLSPIAVACALLALQAAAIAQQSEPSAPSPQPAAEQLETVTVTVQRRAEVLSKAPVAVTVVNQKQLDAEGISSAADITNTVPNLKVAGNGFSMRGIGNNNAFGGYSTVAVQVDGIYEPSYSILGLGLYDIDRIEALRGPQGTVYGRNATAGVVNIETARAGRKFEAFGDVAYGSRHDLTTRGVINVPVSETFAARVSLMKRTNDGYADGGASPRNYGETDVSSARLAWTWLATPDVTWRASISTATNKGTVPDYERLSYTYFPNANIATGTLGTPVTVSPGGNILGYHTATDIAQDLQQTAFRSSLIWHLNDAVSLTYLAGATRLVENGVASSTGLFSLQNKDYTTRTQSHEIDINYEGDALKMVGGLYAYRDRVRGAQKVGIGDALPYPLASVLPPPFVFAPGIGFQPSGFGVIDLARRVNQDANDSKAIFGQATYSVSPALRLTGGARYTKDKFSTDGDTQACAFGTVANANMALDCAVPFGPPASSVAASNSSKVSWRLAADYDLSKEHMVFGSVSTGYRGGGATANVAPQYSTYKPETLTNLEVGWRGRLLNNTLGLNLTAFHMNYKDLQVSNIGQDVFGNNAVVTINSPTAKIKGLEFEGDWLVTKADRFQGFVTYLDARFGHFVDPVGNADNLNGLYNAFAPTPIPGTTADYSGHRLVNAPKISLRGRYAHGFNLAGGGRLTPSIQVFWQSGSYTSLANFSEPARGYRESYSKTDLNLSYESSDRRWTVDAFVYNAEDKKVIASAVSQVSVTTATYLPPRTYGLRVGYRFQ